jgi:phytanoyl-CoA hydroxylase
MREIFRRLKFAYSIYNFFHKKYLQHNLEKFRQYGLNKRYYSSISSRDFKHIKIKEKDQSDLIGIKSTALFKNLSQQDQESLLSFNDNGFAILKSYIKEEIVDSVNAEIENMLKDGRASFRYANKIMFAIHQSSILRSIGNDAQLRELLSSFLYGEAVLFQSINFLMGSEQATHSDSIHMTTFPLGGLLGVWIALEDIGEDNGPLHYYPGSHKLPYYLNSDYDNEGNLFLIGDKSYTAYEEMIQHKIKELGIKKEKFMAKKGDLLIWHANLFHGGEPHLNKNKTRKSMVFLYFDKKAICYHEITQRPALIKSV